MGDIPRKGRSTTRPKGDKNNSEGLRCHVCFGSGHTATECANFLKKTRNLKNKDFNDNIDNDLRKVSFKESSHSDSNNKINSDSEIDSDLEANNKFLQLLRKYNALKKENCEFSIKVKDFEKNENFLKKENFELSLKNENFEKENSKLSLKVKDYEKEIIFLKQNLGESVEKIENQKAEFLDKLRISQSKFLSCDKIRKDLENQMTSLTSELENYKNVSTKFTNGSQGLDKLLGIGKKYGDRRGLGFDKSFNVASSSKTTFVKPTNNVENSPIYQEKMFSKRPNFQNPRSNAFNKFIPICHHCGIVGHIRSKCFKLLNVPSSSKTNFEKVKFFVEKSPISKMIFNSKGTNFSKSKFNTFDHNRNKSTRSSTSHNKIVPTCHYCGCFGHIRPKCYKLLNDQSSFQVSVSNRFNVLMDEIAKLRKVANIKPNVNFSNTKKNEVKKIWVRKENCESKVVPTILKH